MTFYRFIWLKSVIRKLIVTIVRQFPILMTNNFGRTKKKVWHFHLPSLKSIKWTFLPHFLMDGRINVQEAYRAAFDNEDGWMTRRPNHSKDNDFVMAWTEDIVKKRFRSTCSNLKESLAHKAIKRIDLLFFRFTIHLQYFTFCHFYYTNLLQFTTVSSFAAISIAHFFLVF